MSHIWKPSVTVAAIVPRQNGERVEFLMIEETTPDGIRLNQAAGHLDPNESLEQAVTRLAIGSFFTLYLLFSLAIGKSISQSEWIAFYCLAVFEVAALILLIIVSQAQKKSPVRRLLGNWLDVIGTSTFLSLAGDIGVVLIGVYLWVTFGNGFRYGKKYLYHSQAISIVGFFIATLVNPFWVTHKPIVYGFFLIKELCVLPKPQM